MNMVTVIQARTGSNRLPNKVMMPLAGKPMIIRMYERVKASPHAGTVVVATTNEKEDDILYELCREHNIEVFRGHSTDLLDRHYKTGIKYRADVIVKIPSDCPLIDPGIISRVLKFYQDNEDYFDYVSNLHPATYPDGNDVEIIPMNILKFVWENASKTFEREHTTPYIWERPEWFKIGNVEWESNLDYSMTHRWTIDYEEDYLFIKSVYDELYPLKNLFTLDDILLLLKRKPELGRINEKYAGVNWYRHHLGELKTINPDRTREISNML